MADMERLPIKFFAKRNQDSLLVEGGGSNIPPSWLLSEEELAKRSQSLVFTVERLKTEVLRREKAESLIPFVIKAKIIDDAAAKTHRREISNLFQTSRRISVLGLAEADELIVKLETARDVDTIIEKLRNTDGYARALSAIESINGFTPIVSRSNRPEDYKLRLINYQDYEQDVAIRNYFEKAMTELGFDVRKTNYSPEHVVYNVRSVGVDSLEKIQKNDAFGAVFSIEPMPRYRVALDMMPSETSFDVAYPQEDKEYAAVGILDNGIANIPPLEPWITGRWSPYPEANMLKDHGTFVSGVAVYGDRLEGQDWVGIDGVKLFDACVFPDTSKEGVSEDELIANIQEAIKAHHNTVKIWNLSISVTRPVDEFSFSDFAVALDYLQEEYNVLICKSAGNCFNFVKGHPKGRIYEGADSVRSIVVGSIAHDKSCWDFAEIDNPSPFTRIGRGPSYIIKPEVVHYGGNAGVDQRGQIARTGVKSFGLDGSIHKSVGTSHSTPRVAALAAGLYQEIDAEFDPLLLKGLIVHSASYSKRVGLPRAERVNQVGFGRPGRVLDILHNSLHEVTLVLRDQIPRGEYIDIMDFPMPECLIDGEYYRGQIIVTLVYNPILEAAQRAEYCQSNIDVKMGTFDQKSDRDTTRRNILNPVSRDGSQNVLLESCYSKRKMKDNMDDFALKERLLIQYGDKYYPVKKYAVDLSEMTDSNQRKYLTKDKKWYLSLRALFRHHIETKAQLQETSLSQEFCLIITIRDPSEIEAVYDQVSQKLTEHNFWHSNVKLHSEVRLRT